MKRVCLRLWALGLVLLLLPAGAAIGQTLPLENHYKVYMTPPLTVARPVSLVDQFGAMNVNAFVLDKWANPTQKIHNGVTWPMVDPDAHQTWWRLPDAPPQPSRTVIGIDQFGYGPVKLGNAIYLLNPALKNVLPPAAPPYRNHYLCYEVIGSVPLLKPVILIDQFGTCNVVVLRSKLFCNPVEKREGAIIYPILDYAAHLQCYQVDNPLPNSHPITAIDQFGYWQIQTYQNDCLCTPALKEHIVSSTPSTWGKIKSLYR
jgi:hypothetical protein